MRTVVAALLVLVIAGCGPTVQQSPSTSASGGPAGSASGVASTAPSASIAASPTGAPPSPGGSGVAGTTDAACVADDEGCFQALLGDAIKLADQIPTRVEVEEPESFAGGQRTENWVVYLADTVVLVNRFWAAAFAAGRVPYTNVSYVLIDGGQPDQRSACTGPAASATGGPFYCSVGGSGFGRTFQSGTVYIGIPLLVSESRIVNSQNYDFAVVTIVAHELGHHVEHLLFRQNLAKPTTATWWELAADCLAGVFANNAYYGRAGRLTDTDVQEAIQMLYNWGSDLPFDYSGDTHGSRQQRVDAFMTGYNNGSTSGCLAASWPTNF